MRAIMTGCIDVGGAGVYASVAPIDDGEGRAVKLIIESRVMRGPITGSPWRSTWSVVGDGARHPVFREPIVRPCT
jgi:hypothetical protein